MKQTEPLISSVQEMLSNERDISPGQCAYLVASMRCVEGPLQDLYTALKTPGWMPPDINAFRHPLLITLDSATHLFADLMGNLTSFPLLSSPASRSEAYASRQYILQQIETFEVKRGDIEQHIDRLLLKTGMHNEQVSE